MFTKNLKMAIEIAGGQTALARLIDKKQSNVSTWLHRDKKVPADQAIPIARAIDWRITPHQLRPDIYPNKTDGLPEDLRGVAA